MTSSIAKNFDILATILNILYYLDSLIKLFLDLYLTKFLDTSAKPFFPYTSWNMRENILKI